MSMRRVAPLASCVRAVSVFGLGLSMIALQGCGEKGQAFVDQQAGAAKFQPQAAPGDAQAAPPAVDSASVEGVLAKMDQAKAVAPVSAEIPNAQPAASGKSGNGKSDDGVARSSGHGREHSAEDDDEEISDAEKSACKSLTGASDDDLVRVSGSEQLVNLKSSNVIMVKVTGNRNTADLDLSKASGSLKGICVFASGNQSTFSAQIGVKCGRLVYICRGNQSRGDIHVVAGGSIESQVVDIGGHDGYLDIDGEGEYSKDDAVVRGSSDGYSCQK